MITSLAKKIETTLILLVRADFFSDLLGGNVRNCTFDEYFVVW